MADRRRRFEIGPVGEGIPAAGMPGERVAGLSAWSQVPTGIVPWWPPPGVTIQSQWSVAEVQSLNWPVGSHPGTVSFVSGGGAASAVAATGGKQWPPGASPAVAYGGPPGIGIGWDLYSARPWVDEELAFLDLKVADWEAVSRERARAGDAPWVQAYAATIEQLRVKRDFLKEKRELVKVILMKLGFSGGGAHQLSEHNADVHKLRDAYRRCWISLANMLRRIANLTLAAARAYQAMRVREMEDRFGEGAGDGIGRLLQPTVDAQEDAADMAHEAIDDMNDPQDEDDALGLRGSSSSDPSALPGESR